LKHSINQDKAHPKHFHFKEGIGLHDVEIKVHSKRQLSTDLQHTVPGNRGEPLERESHFRQLGADTLLFRAQASQRVITA
jgi:hypothetical protein